MASIVKTIGSENPGGKTATLRNDRAAIERNGFHFPNHISFTPQFFRRFLEDSGAMDATTHDNEVRRRMGNHKFSGEEKDAIRAALFEFVPRYTPVLIVRSDEYPAGTGIWKTRPVAVNFHLSDSQDGGKLVEQALPKIEDTLKDVLSSDFSPSAKEFKRKKGLGESGVMLMPLIGDIFKSSYGPACAPTMSISYIGKIVGKELVSAGLGYDGTNHTPLYFQEMGPDILQVLKDERGYGIILSNSAAFPCKLNSPSPMQAASRLGSLSIRIGDLVKETGPRYLEIAWAALGCHEGAIVQSAPFNIPKLEKKPPSAVLRPLIHTSNVVGTKIAATDKIRFANSNQMEDEDVAFNKDNENYLLVLKTEYARQFQRNWALPAYSNAAAIVFDIDAMKNPLFTHLGGAARELGIPILAGKLNQDAMEHFKNQVENVKALVYADEFIPGGPVGFVSLD